MWFRIYFFNIFRYDLPQIIILAMQNIQNYLFQQMHLR